MYYSSDSGYTDQWSPPDDEPPDQGRWGDLLDRRIVGVVLGAVVLVAGVIAVPQWLDSRSEAAASTGDCVVGLDLTSLVDDPATPRSETTTYRHRYTEWTETILDHCVAAGARHLLVFGIDADTKGQDRPRVTKDFPAFDSAKDLGRQKEARQQWVADAGMPQVEALLKEDLHGMVGTDILSAVSIARDDFTADADFHWLWLLTDGVHGTGYGVNVSRLADGAAAREAVDGLVGDEQLEPGGLAGVGVHMLGVGGGGPSADLSPEQATIVKTFWKDYFATAGADLDYSPNGPRFDS
jgi:hypothetical protein